MILHSCLCRDSFLYYPVLRMMMSFASADLPICILLNILFAMMIAEKYIFSSCIRYQVILCHFFFLQVFRLFLSKDFTKIIKRIFFLSPITIKTIAPFFHMK